MSTCTTESTDKQMQDMATRLEAENPRWMVVFGVYTKQFVAYPRFPVPAGTMAVGTYPPALIGRMHDIELAFGAGSE